MTTLTDKRVLRREEVVALVGLSRSTIYKLIGRGEFPRPVQLGQRATGWRADEVAEWLESRERTEPRTGPGAKKGGRK